MEWLAESATPGVSPHRSTPTNPVQLAAAALYLLVAYTHEHRRTGARTRTQSRTGFVWRARGVSDASCSMEKFLAKIR